MKTVIEMAREANDFATQQLGQDAIPREWRIVRDEKFAALVREDERESNILYRQGFSDAKRLQQDEREKQQEPVAKVIRNEAGQIAMQKLDGSYFDISKHIGHAFYTTPPTAAIAARQMRDAIFTALLAAETPYMQMTMAQRKAFGDAIAALPVPEVQWREIMDDDVLEVMRKVSPATHPQLFARAVIAKFKEKQL